MTGRRRQAAAVVLVAIAVLPTAIIAARQQVPRDPTGLSSETGSITGVVVSDDRDGRPLYRSLVTLSGPHLDAPRTLVTGADGRFRFDRLSPGRFQLSAEKDGYLPTTFGATAPRRTGNWIAVERGASQDVTLRLPRSGVITGVVLDPDGQPAVGAFVNALLERWMVDAGTRRFAATTGGISGHTDSTGTYRLYGLSPGEYLVVATPSSLAGRASIQTISQGEEQRALAEIARAKTGNGSVGPDREAIAADARRRIIAMAPIYHPAASTPGRALTITLGLGEERTGVDIQLQYLPTTTVRVSAVAATADARQASVVLVGETPTLSPGIIQTMAPDAEGRFVFTGVRPGRYVVGARVPHRADDADGAGASSSSYAIDEIVVNGEEVLEVVIAPQPALTISGRVVLDGSKPTGGPLPGPRLTLPTTHVTLIPAVTSGGVPPIEIDASGHFAIARIVPGGYRLGGELPGSRSATGGWWLKSLVVAGRDILDRPLAFDRSSGDAVLTFSDRATELDGWVADAAGAPVLDRTVVIFSTDRDAWFLNSRRVAGLRVGPDGHYAIRNLPAGEYWIVAAPDLEASEWFDPGVLERLAPLALRIRLADAEKKTRNLVAPDR